MDPPRPSSSGSNSRRRRSALPPGARARLGRTQPPRQAPAAPGGRPSRGGPTSYLAAYARWREAGGTARRQAAPASPTAAQLLGDAAVGGHGTRRRAARRRSPTSLAGPGFAPPSRTDGDDVIRRGAGGTASPPGSSRCCACSARVAPTGRSARPCSSAPRRPACTSPHPPEAQSDDRVQAAVAAQRLIRPLRTKRSGVPLSIHLLPGGLFVIAGGRPDSWTAIRQIDLPLPAGGVSEASRRIRHRPM